MVAASVFRDCAVKCLGFDAGDGDVEEVAGDDGAGVGEVDDFVGGGATRPAGGIAEGGTFDEDFKGGVEKFVVEVLAEEVLVGKEKFVAPHFFGGGDVVIKERGGSVGSRGVFENEGVVERGLAKKGTGLLKVVLGLAGEADNDVGGDGDVGHGVAQTAEGVKVGFAGVTAAHGFEDGVGAGLHGQVKVVAELGKRAEGAEKFVGATGGMAREEAEAAKAGDLANGVQKPWEGFCERLMADG